MQLKNIGIIFLTMLIFSCENNQEVTIDSENLLIGNWIEPTYNNEETTFKRGNSLQKESYGVAFKKEGVFIERTSGFCGTPPLTFFDAEGSFKAENTLIEISTNLYPNKFNWRIIELTENKLVVKREVSEQEKDHRVLMNLFTEIQNLSYSETCSNVSNWSFAAYGAKACGGSQGYIAYSKNIDTTVFFQKIEAYTKLEKEFNIKWSVVSDCAIVNPPKKIECKNGNPILIY